MRKLKDRVLARHDKGQSAREIADGLKVRVEYVRATLRRAGRAKPLTAYTVEQLEHRVASLRAQLEPAEQRLQELRGAAE